MSSGRWRIIFWLLVVLLAPLSYTATAAAGDGVIWLTAHSESETDEVWVRMPLEWLATANKDGDATISFNGHKLDCAALWQAHKELPVGESREVGSGLTKEGDKYVARVVSEEPATEQALGKVHILVRDEAGKETDVRFPLDMANALERMGSFLKSFFGIESFESGADRRTHDSGIVTGDLGDLKKLGTYGPFDVLRVRETDGTRVKVSIE